MEHTNNTESVIEHIDMIDVPDKDIDQWALSHELCAFSMKPTHYIVDGVLIPAKDF